MNKFSNKKQNGFTLIEMIVALALFSIVALVAVGALLKILDANKKSINIKTTINNMNFALESMTRELRVGSKYYLTSASTVAASDVGTPTQTNESTGDWLLAFKSANKNSEAAPPNTCNLIYAYRYKVTGGIGILQKAEQPRNSTNCTESLDDGAYQYSFYDLISSDIKITKTHIWYDDAVQPKVFLYFAGYSGIRERDKTEFSLQTTVSQRVK